MTLSLPLDKRMDVPAGDAAIIMLAEAVGRHRALSEVESIVLERAIRRQPKPDRRWTRAEDKLLLNKCGNKVRERLRAADIAGMIGRTPEAVRRRLCDLRKRDA